MGGFNSYNSPPRIISSFQQLYEVVIEPTSVNKIHGRNTELRAGWVSEEREDTPWIGQLASLQGCTLPFKA